MFARIDAGEVPTSGFGIEVPAGDPTALEAAAADWRTLGGTLANQGETLSTAGQVTLGAGSWSGSAASAYAGYIERLISIISTNVDACTSAAGALGDLATDLKTAQQATSAAIADCLAAQQAQQTQQQAADDAATTAQTAHQKAAAAIHPVAASTYQAQATTAESDQRTAQAAADAAGDRLDAAQRRGQQAQEAYAASAGGVTARLTAAGDALRQPESQPELLDAIVTWLGHLNDFSGAGSVGVTKGYVAAVSLAGKRLVSQTERDLSELDHDPAALAAIKAGMPLAPDDPATTQAFELAVGARELADSNAVKALTFSPSEETFGLLGKVPYLAYGLTALDMVLNRNDGVGQAVVVPLGNLALGTAVTEVTAPPVAAAVASVAAGDGTLATVLGASALIPGVGEAVIVGGVTVAVVAGADYVFTHPTQVLHGVEHVGDAIGDGAGDLYGGAKHVVHDLEPWHW